MRMRKVLQKLMTRLDFSKLADRQRVQRYSRFAPRRRRRSFRHTRSVVLLTPV